MSKILLLAFGIAGMASLMYEIVWSRPIQLIFGSTIHSISIILFTFLAGFALGSYLFRNIADRSKNPLFLFSILEFVIGIYGLLILYIFSVLPGIYIAVFAASPILLLLLVVFILIIPTTVIGAAWPVMNKAYIRDIDSVGKDAGRLYSSNSFGAGLGALVAGLFLIPLLGIKNTAIFAAYLNIIIAFIIYIISRRHHD